MIGERQKTFRQEYRSRIMGFYDGYVHIAIIYAMGALVFYVYLQHIENVLWWEWLALPLTFLFTNIFEWWVHKYVMHRCVDIKGLRAIYERHTLNHHRFFTDDEMRFRDHKDWRVTVFPPYALVVFILMSIPAALALGWLISANVGWLFLCTTTGMYLIYEFMHFCCHVDENWFVRNVPLVNTLRRHHTAHHNAHLMMEVNMNLTFPIADWLFGTSDLDRGLLGHLFNGYDTSHLKSALARRPRTPDQAAAEPVGNF
ncbi:MAG: sterol desaturase family protein [Alphaproteobacteria bacterium]|nr:sterol desaturase family protein [Alphaproteobacteria bacterium]